MGNANSKGGRVILKVRIPISMSDDIAPRAIADNELKSTKNEISLSRRFHKGRI